ncbi:MAG: hypothetical protein GY827_12730 [Cytophagales bacterium]|nr:hypothetical protein [Cytophagales bacterium]
MSNIVLTTGRFIKEKAYFEHLTNICPPLELLPISTFLTKSKLENHILDTTFLDKNEFYHYLKTQKPNFVVFFVSPETEEFLLECLAKKEEFGHKIEFLICGKNIENKVEFLLEHEADVVLYDAIEEPLTELIHSLSLPLNIFLDHVKGIAYKNGHGTVTKTERYPSELQAKHFDELLIENLNFHPYLKHQKSKNVAPHLFFNISFQNDTLSEECFRNTYKKLEQEYEIRYVELKTNNDAQLTTWLANIQEDLPPFEIDYTSSNTILDPIAFPRAHRIWLYYPNNSQHENIGWVFTNKIKKQELESLLDIPLGYYHFDFKKHTPKTEKIVQIVDTIKEYQTAPKSFLNLGKWKLKRKVNKLLKTL